MKKLIIFFAIFLFADEKLIISQFQNLKPFYYKNQFVNLKLKSIVAEGNLSITSNNVTIATKTDDNITYYSDINFTLNDKFPILKLTLNDGNVTYEENLTINSQIQNLNAPTNFCGVLSNDFKLKNPMLINYDDKFNILSFDIEGNGNLKDFHLGFDKEKLVPKSKTEFSYSALVPINKNNFNIVYFNLNNFKTIPLTLHIKDEKISTQTDIKPMDKSKIYIIDSLLGGVLVLFIALYWYRKKVIYMILIVLAIASLVFFNYPKPTIVLTKGEKIQILPFKNSTVFMVVGIDTKVKVLNEKNGYKKILFNNKIGWVKQ